MCDWRDPSGKRYIETVDGDRAAAERRLAEIVRSGKQGANKRLTFEEYGDWWLENCAKSQIKDSTFEEYRPVLKSICIRCSGPDHSLKSVGLWFGN